MIQVDSTVNFSEGDVSPDLLETMKNEFTLSLPWGNGEHKIYEYDEETRKYQFPWSAYKFLLETEHSLDLTVGGREVPTEAPKFSPRDGQEEAIRDTVSFLRAGVQERGFSGGILCAGCGKGKTVMASKAILELGVPACVLVHKEFLETQWQVALSETLGSSASVGIFRRNRKDNGKTHDVVVASTQTLTSKKRVIPEEFLDSFGLLVADEVHRYGADVWQKALWKFPSRMRLGLTATPNRMDGMWPVIYTNIGPVVHTLDAEAIENSVYIVKLRTPVNSAEWSQPWRDKIQRRAAMLSVLATHEGRNKAIASQVEKAFAKGRNIMVISERRAQLDALHGLLLASGADEEKTGFLVGGMSKAAKEEAQTKQVIFTTYGMSKEGLDIPRLDTLFLASPQSDIEQTVGRILRDQVGKSHPITVDFVDMSIDELVGQAYNRLRIYSAMGCTIHGDLS